MDWIKLIRSILLIILIISNVYSQDKKNQEVSKCYGTPSYTHFNINNISTWIKNDGESDINQNGNSGLEYPKGSGKTAVFQTGFLYGGKVNGDVRVGGSTYRQGQMPGRILSDGTAQNPDDPDVRIWRVRKDWNTPNASFLQEVIDGDADSEAEAKSNYEYDWNNWPWQYGAPFDDKNNNGTYEPTVDIPGLPGADQTIWFVCNDLNVEQCQNLYGSNPIGLEMQATIWGYNFFTPLKDMFFRKYTIINKSNNTIDSMYLGIWTDPDVGDAGDDLVGSDTTLMMMYAYNGRDWDAQYDYQPPAVGFQLLQGPIVYSLGDTARFNNKSLINYTNLPLSVIYFFIGGDPYYSDPSLGQYNSGTLQMWNLFRGRSSTTGKGFIDPITGKPTKFCLSGDPIKRTGWIDGVYYPLGDRRIGLVASPFNMAPGDTQEFIVAEVLGGAKDNLSNIGAIGDLRKNAKIANLFYQNGFGVASNLFTPKLSKTELDQEIILIWGFSEANYSQLEFADFMGYKFQGYNIYQLPTPTSDIKDAVRIATYDLIDGVLTIKEEELDQFGNPENLVSRQFGTDSGIKRYFNVNYDYINKKFLSNGAEYYFTLTAYLYNDNPEYSPRHIETPMEVITCIPKDVDAGTRYLNNFGDIISVEHVEGNGNGNLEIVVIDPTKLTGHSYELKFSEDNNGLYWQLTDSTLSNKLLYKGYNFNEGDASPIVDGFQIKLDTITSYFSVDDIYRFMTIGKAYSEELAKKDLDRINIYPNPYYGANPNETKYFETFVTINHLPEYHKVNIKIYDLAGQLVKRIWKYSSGEQEIKWDLTNEDGIPVASGIFLIHIEIPDYGYEKILKVGIIQEQKIPYRY
ncbi:MAG: hypothetical protein JXA68_11060 [Ignavibacteriales bacterium]|nr:hypothetical protein [Ignavibacteriales bacterium]